MITFYSVKKEKKKTTGMVFFFVDFVGSSKFTKALLAIHRYYQLLWCITWAIPEPISPPPMTVTWLNAFALCALVAKERTKLLHRFAITSLFFGTVKTFWKESPFLRNTVKPTLYSSYPISDYINISITWIYNKLYK